MDNIFIDIIDWAQDKHNFWQHAIYRILTKNVLEESDITDLLKFCKIGSGLIKENLPEINLKRLRGSISNSEFDGEIVISKIKNVENIKALREGEELTFSNKGITAVYGDNGSGKSSYVGILKHICKTRGFLPTITKNLYNSDSSQVSQKAEVEYTKNGVAGVVEWKDNNISSSILKVVDVFDAHSANHYIEGEDEIAFIPSGLLVLEKLALCCKAIKEKIETEINDLENNAFDFSFLLEEKTEVTQFLENINHETTLTDLRKYSKFNEDHQQNLEKINKEIEQLRRTDPKRLIEENNKKIERIRILKEKYEQIENALTKEKIDSVVKIVTEYNELEKAIDEISKRTFMDLPIEGIGNTTWKHLWESARKFIDEIKGENVFPETDENAICPLCLQKLDDDAKQRFINFEEYVKQDIQTKFNLKREEINKGKQKYESLDINFNTLSTTIEEINEIDKQFKESHNNYLKTVSGYKKSIVAFIDAKGKKLEPKNPI